MHSGAHDLPKLRKDINYRLDAVSDGYLTLHPLLELLKVSRRRI